MPASVLFMNSGVKLVAGDEQQIIDSVNKLIEKGTEVLVCGTCLDFYGLKEQLKVGEVSNMYTPGPYARSRQDHYAVRARRVTYLRYGV